MKIRDGMERQYQECFDVNDDAYGRRCFTYAEDWADKLEVLIDDGDPAIVIATHAKQTASEADTDGITGFMYGTAVSVLSEYWEYGDLLRRWHNLDTQLGVEGEKANESGGVLNPALLTIG